MSKEFEEKVLEKLDSIDTRLNSLDTRVDSIDTRLNLVEGKVSEIDTIKTKLNSVEQKLETMNESIILIEHKVSIEIPALFDGYSSNYDLQKEDEKKINSLKQENFNHSIRIANLEITTDEHSKQIKKLIS